MVENRLARVEPNSVLSDQPNAGLKSGKGAIGLVRYKRPVQRIGVRTRREAERSQDQKLAHQGLAGRKRRGGQICREPGRSVPIVGQIQTARETTAQRQSSTVEGPTAGPWLLVVVFFMLVVPPPSMLPPLPVLPLVFVLFLILVEVTIVMPMAPVVVGVGVIENRPSPIPFLQGFPDGGTAERTGASADHGTFNGCAVCRTDQGACICSHGASDERALAGPGIMLRVAAGGQRQRSQEGDYGNIQLHGHTPAQKETWPPMARPALRLRDILRAAPDILRAAVEPRYPAFVCWASKNDAFALPPRKGGCFARSIWPDRNIAAIRFGTIYSGCGAHLRPPMSGFPGGESYYE